jgi:hypothetical protein
MSTLIVENLKGPTTGANANKIIVPSGQTLDASGGTITPSSGQIVNVTTVQDTGINGSASSNSFVEFFNFSLTATAGNKMCVITSIPTRGNASSGWNLTVVRISAAGTIVCQTGYEGQAGTSENIQSAAINGAWIWGGTGSNAQTISVAVRAYDGNTRSIGTNGQDTSTTTPVFTFMEIAA